MGRVGRGMEVSPFPRSFMDPSTVYSVALSPASPRYRVSDMLLSGERGTLIATPTLQLIGRQSGQKINAVLAKYYIFQFTSRRK